MAVGVATADEHPCWPTAHRKPGAPGLQKAVANRAPRIFGAPNEASDGQGNSDDRHDRRATAGSGDPGAALAAEAGHLKAKVDRLVAVATRPTTDCSTSGQTQVSKLLALTGTPPSGALGPQLLRPKQAGAPTVGRSCKLLPRAKSIPRG
jgi:hypothetical protein